MPLDLQEKTQFIDVAIPLPVDDPYTYRIPPAWAENIQPGCRVRVPFRNRTIVGFVVSVNSQLPEEGSRKILEISEVLDRTPVLDEHQLRLAKWIGEYYFSSWGEAISNMIPKLLKSKSVSPRQRARLAQPEAGPESIQVLQLTDEQEQAAARITASLWRNTFEEFFLFGVTGSGKTEVYIRAIKETLKRGKSAICLVPEIALTEQLERFFTAHFRDQLEIVHSKFSTSDRYQGWRRILAGEKRVILGARSAIFAPAKNLGLIIIDEEQEGSYKQDQTPRYHAREAARWRAQDLGALLLLGTATPSLETMYRVSTGEAELLRLTKRVDGRILPDVKIVDLKAQEGSGRSCSIISPPLRSAIEKALAAKEGILILLNRRGYATHVQCTHCGEALFCSYCAVPLTFHQDKQEALCHYCNFKTSVLSHCRKCGQPTLQFRGIGTEKVESEIARLFPAARVARLDRDTVRKRGSHEQILSRFRKGEIDILVGTQMIAKGFDFQHVNVAGVVNADTGLMLPDFRSSERTFQLLTQMAGRTGRGNRSGTVFIQTYSPGHYAIQYASKHESQGFFLEEMKSRRALKYPPVVQLVNVVFRGKIESRTYEQAHHFKQLFQDLSEKEVTLIGPAPMPIYRLRNQFRWHVLLKGSKITHIQTAIKQVLLGFKRKSGVHLAVDVDPIAIL